MYLIAWKKAQGCFVRLLKLVTEFAFLISFIGLFKADFLASKSFGITVSTAWCN